VKRTKKEENNPEKAGEGEGAQGIGRRAYGMVPRLMFNVGRARLCFDNGFIGNERRYRGRLPPYLASDGTIDECIREFMTKPTAPPAARHLAEISYCANKQPAR